MSDKTDLHGEKVLTVQCCLFMVLVTVVFSGAKRSEIPGTLLRWWLNHFKSDVYGTYQTTPSKASSTCLHRLAPRRFILKLCLWSIKKKTQQSRKWKRNQKRRLPFWRKKKNLIIFAIIKPQMWNGLTYRRLELYQNPTNSAAERHFQN